MNIKKIMVSAALCLCAVSVFAQQVPGALSEKLFADAQKYEAEGRWFYALNAWYDCIESDLSADGEVQARYENIKKRLQDCDDSVRREIQLDAERYWSAGFPAVFTETAQGIIRRDTQKGTADYALFYEKGWTARYRELMPLLSFPGTRWPERSAGAGTGTAMTDTAGILVYEGVPSWIIAAPAVCAIQCVIVASDGTILVTGTPQLAGGRYVFSGLPNRFVQLLAEKKAFIEASVVALRQGNGSDSRLVRIPGAEKKCLFSRFRPEIQKREYELTATLEQKRSQLNAEHPYNEADEEKDRTEESPAITGMFFLENYAYTGTAVNKTDSQTEQDASPQKSVNSPAADQITPDSEILPAVSARQILPMQASESPEIEESVSLEMSAEFFDSEISEVQFTDLLQIFDPVPDSVEIPNDGSNIQQNNEITGIAQPDDAPGNEVDTTQIFSSDDGQVTGDAEGLLFNSENEGNLLFSDEKDSESSVQFEATDTETNDEDESENGDKNAEQTARWESWKESLETGISFVKEQDKRVSDILDSTPERTLYMTSLGLSHDGHYEAGLYVSAPVFGPVFIGLNFGLGLTDQAAAGRLLIPLSFDAQIRAGYSLSFFGKVTVSAYGIYGLYDYTARNPNVVGVPKTIGAGISSEIIFADTAVGVYAWAGCTTNGKFATNVSIAAGKLLDR